jgi:hypothetical protein
MMIKTTKRHENKFPQNDPVNLFDCISDVGQSTFVRNSNLILACCPFSGSNMSEYEALVE